MSILYPRVPTGCMWPRMAMMGPKQNQNLLNHFFAHQFLLLLVYLVGGPRQLFFQCGPEMPKVWIPLHNTHPISWLIAGLVTRSTGTVSKCLCSNNACSNLTLGDHDACTIHLTSRHHRGIVSSHIVTRRRLGIVQ